MTSVCLCVVDGDRLVGVVTKLDFLEPISQMEAAERHFTVQFGVKDMEISADQQDVHDGMSLTVSHVASKKPSRSAHSSFT